MSPSAEPASDRSHTSLRPGSPKEGTCISKALVDAGYTQEALAGTIGLSHPGERQDVEVTYRRVRADTPYNLLVRLLWLGRPVREELLRRLTPDLDVDRLVFAGLLRCHDGDIRSAARLAPYHDLFLASDFGPETGRTLLADHVLGVGAASQTLAGMTVRRKVRRALDLGCGAGIQTFLVSSHADLAIGTDVSTRALAFAEFNSWLNGVSNVQWRAGSLYEPVRDETFDLIVANPPFVISPESTFIFRDGGLPGDTLSYQVVRNACPRLTEGGFACILFNWHHQDDSDWAERPSQWVAETGCDALLICFKSAEPLTYAADWLRSSLGRNVPEFGQRLDEWQTHYERMGIGRISAGVIVLRRRAGASTWFSARRLGSARSIGSCGRQVEAMFDAEDLLAGIGSERDLLQYRFRLCDDHQLRHEFRVADGRWVLDRQTLHLQAGMLFSGDLDIATMELLARCDGRRPLGEALASVAESLNMETEQMRTACTGVVRGLLQSGFLYVCRPDGCEDTAV